MCAHYSLLAWNQRLTLRTTCVRFVLSFFHCLYYLFNSGSQIYSSVVSFCWVYFYQNLRHTHCANESISIYQRDLLPTAPPSLRTGLSSFIVSHLPILFVNISLIPSSSLPTFCRTFCNSFTPVGSCHFYTNFHIYYNTCNSPILDWSIDKRVKPSEKVIFPNRYVCI